MSLHLQRDLENLKKEILLLGHMVEEGINNAILALNSRRTELAESVLTGEKAINQKEVFIEEECLKILALHQPVAIDLRFIVVVLKVNNDLERMGDFAVNIAKRAMFLAKHEPLACPREFTDEMPAIVKKMVGTCLNSLVKLDKDLARSVIFMDDDVDAINRKMYVELQEIMKKDPSTVERAIQMLSSSRYLERVADLATNIAEDVVFMAGGEVIRHQAVD